MNLPLSRSALVRVAPFAVFMLLLGVRGALPAGGDFDARWVYGLGVALTGAVLLWFRQEYGEFARQNLPTAAEAALAVAVGALVFWLWIVLDAPWMQIGTATAGFTPLTGDGQPMWPLIAVRWIGAALLVPVMEELFWRSFLMRWIEHATFEAVDPQRVGLKAIVLSTFVFMLAHTLWLAAIVAGLAYAWLYRHTGKLWVAVIAHAVTNGALGVWVVVTGNWAYW
jgi:CAAX prenyl protease-like protein